METMKIGKNYFIRDVEQGYYPLLTLELKRRIKNKEACILCVVGEAGTSKSYTAIQLARNLDRRFSIKQIVFTYSDYLKELNRKRKLGLPIVFDEPSYAMSKREWYNQLNQALVKAIESQRYLVRPLIIPIINIGLLDKTIRDHLIIFQVHMTKRGRAMVYRVRASQGENKTYRYFMCFLDYPILDFENCDRDTCLDCTKLEALKKGEKESCTLLRALYEVKKDKIQSMRYEMDEAKARILESKDLTIEQLCILAKPYEKDYTDDDKINVNKLQYIFNKLGIKIGHNKAYTLKTYMDMEKQILSKPIE